MNGRNAQNMFRVLLFLCLPVCLIMTPSRAQGGFFKEWRQRRQAGDRRIEWRGRKSEKSESADLKEIKGDYSSNNYTLGPGNYTRQIDSGGITRYYDIHVPASYSRDKPTPVVLNLHGGSGNPKQQRRDSGMDAVADKNGFIAVYPAGTSAMGKLLTWNIGSVKSYATKKNIDDIGYFRRLLPDLTTIFNVDGKRVYATGISQGAMMCYRLACELSDKIAAIAPVAGVMQVPDADRKPTHSMPIIHFHGLEDKHVTYDGSVSRTLVGDVDRPSVPETINWWIAKDGLKTTPTKEGKMGAAEYSQYTSADGRGEIVLWTLTDGGHTWPGGDSPLPESRMGKTNRDINASELMWEFFAKHALP